MYRAALIERDQEILLLRTVEVREIISKRAQRLKQTPTTFATQNRERRTDARP
jgi:hypothetical protein